MISYQFEPDWSWKDVENDSGPGKSVFCKTCPHKSEGLLDPSSVYEAHEPGLAPRQWK